MPYEPDKISSYYHKSAKPSFFFYRATVIASMVALLTVLGINLYTLNQTTSITSKAAQPTPTPSSLLATPTASNAAKAPPEPTLLNQHTLPPLPPQCHYEPSTTGTTIKCTEGEKSCTYRIVNDKYVMECN